jgi:hypothetical protein
LPKLALNKTQQLQHRQALNPRLDKQQQEVAVAVEAAVAAEVALVVAVAVLAEVAVAVLLMVVEAVAQEQAELAA